MNLKKMKCEYCDDGHMVEEVFSQTQRSGRAKLTVDGLHQCRCDVCDTVVTTSAQFESNATLIEAAEKNASGYVSVGMLKQFREKYSLTQKEAGKLIGAGEGAFGKYETGARLSAPTAKLIRVALALPEVVELLAREEGFHLARTDHAGFIARPSNKVDGPLVEV